MIKNLSLDLKSTILVKLLLYANSRGRLSIISNCIFTDNPDEHIQKPLEIYV